MSSNQAPEGPNVNANDGRLDTRWASGDHNDAAWWYVDLGSVEKVKQIRIYWETAFASEYHIQMSKDAIVWVNVATVKNTEPTTDTITFDAFYETQFVRFQGVKRFYDGTGDKPNYGYSFYQFEVYGAPSLGLGSTVTVSSFENQTSLPAEAITDNDATTRWASIQADQQYVVIDLGEEKTFDHIKIRWENFYSFARRFKIYASDQALVGAGNWGTLIYSSDAGLGEVDDLRLYQRVTSRYVKLELIQRETSEIAKEGGRYPFDSTYSIYSFELFDWASLDAIPIGNKMEFNKNGPAWSAMSNITLFEDGLVLAPIGYITEAKANTVSGIRNGEVLGFESYATYNPAVIVDENGRFHMIYRSEIPDNLDTYFGDRNLIGHMSTLSYAYSDDGYNFIRGENNPFAWPIQTKEEWGGLEDPRIFRIDDTYYVTFTMYQYGGQTRMGMIYTKNFIDWTRVMDLAPNFGGDLKSGTYLVDPEGNAVQIQDPRPGKTGKVYMIYMKDGGYSRVGFTNDVRHIANDDIIDLADSKYPNSIQHLIGGSESCVAITNVFGPDDEDIFLMYGGGFEYQMPNANGWFYALGVVRLTKSNPFELANGRQYDIVEPWMYPTDTNKIDYGLYRKCMFADTILRYNDQWYFYYGAGDMYVGGANATSNVISGAPTITMTKDELGDVIEFDANTMVLNKKHGDDQTPETIQLVIQAYRFNHELIEEYSQITEVEVNHFSQNALGSYYQGDTVQVNLDVSDLDGSYYVLAYVQDTLGNMLSNTTSYVVSQPSIQSEVR